MPRKFNQRPSRHVEMVRLKLVEHDGQFGEIVKKTGISMAWLKQFSQGVYIDPGSARIELLASVLGWRVLFQPCAPQIEPKAVYKQRKAAAAEQVRAKTKDLVFGKEKSDNAPRDCKP